MRPRCRADALPLVICISNAATVHCWRKSHFQPHDFPFSLATFDVPGVTAAAVWQPDAVRIAAPASVQPRFWSAASENRPERPGQSSGTLPGGADGPTGQPLIREGGGDGEETTPDHLPPGSVPRGRPSQARYRLPG